MLQAVDSPTHPVCQGPHLMDLNQLLIYDTCQPDRYIAYAQCISAATS